VAAALAGYVDRGGKLLIAGEFAATDANGRPVELPEDVAASLSRATRLPDTSPDTILEALGDAARPVRLSSDATVMRPLMVDTAPQATDWPQDMTESSSLGQSLRLPHGGLSSIAIRTPTYLKTPPAGFTLELLADGPGGRIIAQRQVPPGVADNSWQELEIPEPPPAGSTIYVRAVPDPGLPSLHLGWWSTHSDPYADGSAYVGDRPVSGDRQVKMTFRVPVPAVRLLEAFALSDGLDYGIVLVNTGAEAVQADVELRRLLSPELADRYEITCPVHPGIWRPAGPGGELRLPAHGATMLYARCRVSTEEAQGLVERASAALEAWRQRDALTPYARYAAAKAAEQMAAGRTEKAAAMALRVLSQMGMSAMLEAPNGAAAVRARCYDAAGESVAPDTSTCRFTPTCTSWRSMTIGSDGRAEAPMVLRRLPGVYNYAAGQYQRYDGPLRICVQARRGTASAATWIDITTH